MTYCNFPITLSRRISVHAAIEKIGTTTDDGLIHLRPSHPTMVNAFLAFR